MRSHLHADDVRPFASSARAADERWRDELPRFKTRPPWLIFLAKHLAPRNHARYQMQGSDIPQEVWDRAFPPLTEEEEARLGIVTVKHASGERDPAFTPVRKRPRWLAFLYRHLPLPDDE